MVSIDDYDEHDDDGDDDCDDGNEAVLGEIVEDELTLWRKINLYTFLANIELADRMLLSAEDITAADTAPNPKNETKSGVKYCKTNGRIMVVSLSVSG